jgi:hypothetical protein
MEKFNPFFKAKLTKFSIILNAQCIVEETISKTFHFLEEPKTCFKLQMEQRLSCMAHP